MESRAFAWYCSAPVTTRALCPSATRRWSPSQGGQVCRPAAYFCLPVVVGHERPRGQYFCQAMCVLMRHQCYGLADRRAGAETLKGGSTASIRDATSPQSKAPLMGTRLA